ncbi:beta-1,3-glucan-binding protein-like isoform X2 [Anneissia japonica]|uniref:beta-1,3-glucan-binding protein-like isoform X2 n=1 Tax=Anneissia japonica TaxID=1529436 RepID=UPI0014259DB6|nr:beta-1,3-glucan-binding protein-like isoform X2 [Anneissia japonica]
MKEQVALAGLALCLVLSSVAAYTVPPAQLSLISPKGLRISIPDGPGISLFAVHYSINKALPGVAAGDWNYDVTSPKNGYWVHENTLVTVNDGDVVNYWLYVLYNGLGYQELDLSWTASESKPTNAPPKVPTTIPGDGGDAGTDAPGTLIFDEQFDTFDLDRWEHEITAGGGGNWEFQYYTNNRSNSYVRDGKLYIKPTLTEDKYGDGFLNSGVLNIWGASPADLCTGNYYYGCERSGSASNYINPIQSARLRTVKSFAFTHGRLEVEAKMPTGDWLWPAIWLLPKHNNYGGWPASGEIDLVESRGNLNLKDSNGDDVGVQQMGSTMHWGPFWPMNGYPKTHATKTLSSGTFGSSFHKYAMEWTADNLKFFIDDELILTVDPGSEGFWGLGNFAKDAPGIDNPWQYSSSKLVPFDQPFYLIMNVAVGGTAYFSDSFTNSPYPKPWLNNSPTAAKDFWLGKNNWYPTWNPDTNNGEDAAMQVNYVKVWKL